MHDVDYAEIKRLIPVPDLLRAWGWQPLVIAADVRRGPCPIHGSRGKRSRSFAASSTGWCCHSCKRQGDVIRLWSERRGATMHQAAIELCRFMAVPVPYRPARRRAGNGEEERTGGTRGAAPPAHGVK